MAAPRSTGSKMLRLSAKLHLRGLLTQHGRKRQATALLWLWKAGPPAGSEGAAGWGRTDCRAQSSAQAWLLPLGDLLQGEVCKGHAVSTVYNSRAKGKLWH